mgnify:CR=1 FL=1
MTLITISNLYPRPDEPQRGLFNAQQFGALADIAGAPGRQDPDGAAPPAAAWWRSAAESRIANPEAPITNIALVPEWRIWRRPAIRRWQDPRTNDLNTRYVPVFYIPLIGRNQSWRFYSLGLRSELERLQVSRRSGHDQSAHPERSRVPLRPSDAAGGGTRERSGAAASPRLPAGARSEAPANEVFHGSGPSTLLFATWLYPDAVAAAVVARRLGLPLWIKAHGSDRFHLAHPSRRARILEACEYAEGVICVSRPLADVLAEAGVERPRLHVVPNGVDTGRFRHCPQQEARAQLQDRIESLGLPACPPEAVAKRPRRRVSPLARRSPERSDREGGSPIVLFAGNLALVKGLDVLLDALTALCGATRDTRHATPGTCPRLLVLGDGPQRNRLEGAARRRGISGSVTFLGSRPHAEMPLWFNAADCLCLPSRSEGMPNVVLEALACGLPVVASDVGACRELLDQQPGCRLVAPDDAEGLALALCESMGEAVDRKALACDNAERLSWQASAERLLALMQRGQDD